MKAAASSCLTWMNWISPWRFRSASMVPLIPSPGSPKTTSTPQSMRMSTIISAAVCFAMAAPSYDQDIFGLPINPILDRTVGILIKASRLDEDFPHLWKLFPDFVFDASDHAYH